jgi:hypothetical protein
MSPRIRGPRIEGDIVKLSTVSVDCNCHLVFEEELEGIEWEHKFRVKQKSPTIIELATGICGKFT